MINCALLCVALLQIAAGSLDLPAGYDECILTPDNPCSIAEMTRPTLVSPGGKTVCADGSDYSFRVVPGEDKDNVLLFFQGGGACFGTETCEPVVNNVVNSIYLSKIKLDELGGILNHEDPRNPFRKFSSVEVLYCTGDTHVGDSVTPVLTGNGVRHNGINNTEAVLKWTYENFPSPKKLIVSGSSAGSIGAQVWSGNIIQRFKQQNLSTEITVIADSFMAALPSGRAGKVVDHWGSCDYDFLWTTKLKRQCHQKRLYFPDLIANIIKTFPDVRFAFIHSNRDAIQKAFYCLVRDGIDAANVDVERIFNCLSQEEFGSYVQPIVDLYKSVGENAYFYFLDGEKHCYLYEQIYYTAISQHNECLQPIMNEWIQDVVDGKPVDNIPMCKRQAQLPGSNFQVQSFALKASVSQLLIAITCLLYTALFLKY